MKLFRRLFIGFWLGVIIIGMFPAQSFKFVQAGYGDDLSAYGNGFIPNSIDSFNRQPSGFSSRLDRGLAGERQQSPAQGDYPVFLPLILSSDTTDILGVSFPSFNKDQHHTGNWVGNYVFRRAQKLTVQVQFSGNYQATEDDFIWRVLEPGQQSYQPIPKLISGAPGPGWSVKEINVTSTELTVEIFIPVDAALGEHRFEVSLYRDVNNRNVFQDIEYSPSFFVIFNPFEDDGDTNIDSQVYNAYFSPNEINYYSTSTIERNYYAKVYDPQNNKWVLGGEIIWVLNMSDPVVFLPVIDEVQGVRSAKEAVRLLAAKARWNHKGEDEPTDSDIIEGNWKGQKYNWLNVPEMMSFWNWGENHPTGQCMDFGGLMAAMARAIGVPSRLVTCAYCHSGLGYEYHVWTEVWLNEVDGGAWSAVDSMEDIGPVPRNDPYFRGQLTDGKAVYTFDFRTNKRKDVKKEY